MDRIKSNNKVLVGVLIGLVIIVIGLIVGIAVANNNNGKIDSGEDSSTDDGEADFGYPDLEEQNQYIDSLEKADVSYEISLKISDVYNSGDKDMAMRMYDEELNKALAEKNYELFIELVSTRSTMLFSDEECEKAVRLYDDIDATVLPADYQITLYSLALSDSADCENEEKEQYWDNKFNEALGGQEYVDVRP